MEFWSSTVPDHSNLIYTPVSIRDVDRKKATFEPSSSPIQHRGIAWTLPGFARNYSEDNLPLLLPQGTTELGTWTTSVCQGSAMETFGEQLPLINQLLNQIPTGSGSQTTPSWRRTRSMIKPRSLPSHFESFRQKHNRGTLKEIPVHVLIHPSTSLNGQSMLPVTPMTSVTTPATIDRDSQVGCTRSYHRGNQSPQVTGEPPPVPQMTYTKMFNTIHQRCSSSFATTPSRK